MRDLGWPTAYLIMPASGFYELPLAVADPSLAHFIYNLKIVIIGLSLKLDSAVNVGLVIYRVLVLEM